MRELRSPDWLLAGIDAGHDVCQFARVSSATYRDSAFLDHRIRPRPTEVRSVTGEEADRLLASAPPRPGAWIFHTAFCCSTLLAFCLDRPGRTLVLREPAVLSKLAAAVRANPNPGLGAMTRRVLRLVERDYGGEAVAIKPSNYANALLPAVLAEASSARRCVLLSCSLRELLLSLLNKRAEAERLLPALTAALLSDSDYRQCVDVPPVDSLPLLPLGVVFWHCQRHFFQRSRAGADGSRTMGLTMQRFLAEPAEVLAEISVFLGLGLDHETITHTVEAGAFRQHAKAGKAYGPDDRRREADALAKRHADEIAAALDWAQPRLRTLPPEPLTAGEDPLGT